MSDLPKIVKERLRSVKSMPDIHPDADLLTAFAEKSLTAPERARLVHHLADCADCRDVIALALPVIEGIQDVRSGAETHAGWFRWPVLRWGVVVAGIAIAVFAGILEFQHRENSKTLASSALHQNEVASTAAAAANHVETDHLQGDLKGNQAPNEPKLAASATTDASEPLNNGDRSNPTGLAASRLRPSFATPRQKAAKAAPTHRLDSEQELKKSAPTQADQQLPLDAPRPSPSSETVEVFAQEQASAAAPAPVQSPIQSNESLQARAAEPAFSDQATVAKAKPAVINPAINGGSAAPASQQNQLTTLQLYRAPARWTISSSGRLQRSFDGGKSWQAVDVEMVTAANANGTISRTAPSKAAPDGIAEERVATARATKDENARVVFRAVFAAGSDVWAGGSGGMLYHSIDGGEQWSRVRPFTANEFPTTDIVSIEFSDGMHGKITTSRAELWITNDGGRSWQQQK